MPQRVEASEAGRRLFQYSAVGLPIKRRPIRARGRAHCPLPGWLREAGSPDLAALGLGLDHLLTRLAGEGTLELGHVHHHAVDAIAARRMRVGQGLDSERLGPRAIAV